MRYTSLWSNVASTAIVLGALAGGLTGGQRPAVGSASALPWGPRDDFAGAPVRLEVDLSERTLTVFDQQGEIASYRVSVGSPEHPTPTGGFGIRRMVWNPRWVPPDSPWAKGARARAPGDPANPMQVVKIFFREPAYYIHGTPSENSLGEAASHGCLRMAPDDVKELGLLLMERTGDTRGRGWVDDVLAGDLSEEVLLAREVPIEVHR